MVAEFPALFVMVSHAIPLALLFSYGMHLENAGGSRSRVCNTHLGLKS